MANTTLDARLRVCHSVYEFASKRILKNRCVPKFGKRAALSIEPLEVEQWLKSLKREHDFENPTLDKTRRVMSLVYKHGQRYGLIPRTEEANPMRFVRCKTTSDYEAMILTPQQAFIVLMNLEEPERTLTLLAASTGLRISECTSMYVVLGHVAKSESRRVKRLKLRFRYMECLPSSFAIGSKKPFTADLKIGSLLPLE
jgi:hypothetical protein